MRRRLGVFALGLLVGAGLGVGAGYLYWGRRVAAFGDSLRERREMAETAEHLRTQVEQQVERLESLARELVPTPTPPDADGSP